MARASWLADVLSDAGLTVKSFQGWETRGANSITPRGVMLHHTVTRPATADPSIDYFLAVKGSSTTPGPLCNYSTNRDGSVSIIAAGTANHGGVGVWKGITGNRFFFGDEMKNLGTSAEPWPERQLESARTAAAAILKHIGATAEWVCGHKEYATPKGRKSDPHSLNMTTERMLIDALLKPTQEDTDMLPLKKGEKREDVRLLQIRLNKAYDLSLALTSEYDAPTVAAVKANLASFTGSPAGKLGEEVVATMWEALFDAVLRQAGPIDQVGTVDTTARLRAANAETAATAAHSRLDRLKTI